MSRLLDLDAYLTGELADPQAEALEDALFDAPDDPDLAFVDRVAQHGKRLAAHGTFDIGVPLAHIEALRAQGHVLHIIDAGTPTAELRTMPVPPGGEMLATCLDLGRTDLEMVDIEICVLEHGVTKVLKDVHVDRISGKIYALCERPLADLALTAGPTRTSVRHRDGERAVIAEWLLQGQAI